MFHEPVGAAGRHGTACRAVYWVIAAGLAVVVLALAACSDDSPAEEPQPAAVAQAEGEQPATPDPPAAAAQSEGGRQASAGAQVGAQRTLLSPRWPSDHWRPLVEVAAANAQLQFAIELGLEWCAESRRRAAKDNLTFWGAPEIDGEWRRLDGPTLIDQDAQSWVAAVAQATADRRGIPPGEMPSIQIISPQWERAGVCQYWGDGRDDFPYARLSALRIWQRALGLAPPHWTPEMLDQMPVPDFNGWYTTVPGGRGSITLISSASEHDMARALSNQLVGHLQQQVLDSEYSRRQPWAVESDRWHAMSWLLEADAAHATLASDHPALNAAAEQLGAYGNAALDLSLPPASLPDELFYWWTTARSEGSQFIVRLLLEVGADAVDQRLRELPDTTEQLLHSDKYDAREPALDLAPLQAAIDSAVPIAQWSRFRDRALGEEGYRDTYGELGLRTLLRASTGRIAEADAAAAGWGGDRLHLFHRAGGSEREALALWAIAFDDAEEHAEGAAGLREWLIAYSNGFAWGERDGRILGWDGPDSAIRVVDGGTVAWLIAAPDGETADATAALLRDAETPTLWGVR